jgi:hypothetical protein
MSLPGVLNPLHMTNKTGLNSYQENSSLNFNDMESILVLLVFVVIFITISYFMGKSHKK